jgi:hypothetical protein
VGATATAYSRLIGRIPRAATHPPPPPPRNGSSLAPTLTELTESRSDQAGLIPIQYIRRASCGVGADSMALDLLDAQLLAN